MGVAVNTGKASLAFLLHSRRGPRGHRVGGPCSKRFVPLSVFEANWSTCVLASFIP